MQVFNYVGSIPFDQIQVGDIIPHAYRSRIYYVSSKTKDVVNVKLLGSSSKSNVGLYFTKVVTTNDIRLPYSEVVVLRPYRGMYSLNASYRHSMTALKAMKGKTVKEIIEFLNGDTILSAMSVVDMCNSNIEKRFNHILNYLFSECLCATLGTEEKMWQEFMPDSVIERHQPLPYGSKVVKLMLLGRSFDNIQARYKTWYDAYQSAKKYNRILRSAMNVDFIPFTSEG